MAFTTIAFYEHVDQGGAYVALNGVADQHVRVVGDDIQVPDLAQVILVAGGVEGTTAYRARLVSPSLRERSLFQLAPLNSASATATEPSSPPAIVDLRDNPVVLVKGEQLNFEALADPATPEIQWGVVWLADGPPTPIKGPMFTARATGSTTLSAGSWTNVALTWDEDLPRGRYQAVGLLPISAGMIAARFVFVGGGYRPGALGNDALSDLGSEIFRYGRLGVFGEFEDNEPPTIDCLAVSADTIETFYIDLIQIRKGPA